MTAPEKGPGRPPDGDAAAEAREGTAAAVRALWERHRATMWERVESVEAAARTLARGEPAGPLREQAVQEAHRLVGSLGIFGLAEGSAVAERLESALRAGAPPDDAASEALLADAAALRREVESMEEE